MQIRIASCRTAAIAAVAAVLALVGTLSASPAHAQNTTRAPAVTAGTASRGGQITPASASDVAAFERALAASDRVAAADKAAYRALPPDHRAQFVAAVLSDDPFALPGVVTTSSATTTKAPTGLASQNASPAARSGSAVTAATVYNVTTTSRFDSTLFGITLGYWKQVFRYQTGNNKVLSVQSCVGTWTGFSGFWSVSEATHFWLSSGQGTCITIYTGSVLYKGSNLAINKEMGLIVNGPGIVDRWLVNV